ncbi:glutaredoxin domain-containing protein [Aminobacter sp. J41]|nr:glutaredoxin domain-containing protein [Aminobacter sp. J41]
MAFTILGRKGCSYCVKAEETLKKMGVLFNKFDIVEQPALTDFLISCGLQTVPQIYVGSKHIGGYDDLLKFLESWD